MILQLFDDKKHPEFAPLSLTRPIGNLRCGILTNDERWGLLVPDAEITFETEPYLQDKFKSSSKAILINGRVIPNHDLVEQTLKLTGNEALVKEGIVLARSGTGEIMIQYNGEEPVILDHRWDLYQKNGIVLEQDFRLITKGRTSVQLSSTNTIIGDPNRIFLEEGAVVEAAVINTKGGPVYIGKNAEVMEGTVIRGPLALCDHAALKLGAKVYGPTTLGPHCKVGGEVNNVVFQSYSNKGHDGFLGNSVIGEWCNIGADTNTSNLKNNYGNVKTYSYRTEKIEPTNIQFMGLMMGDHSKCGINTMFNTATVVGVSCNIFGDGFPPKHVPSFSWGVQGERFDFNKAVESANNMMSRRGTALSEEEIAILRHLADKK